MIYAYVQGYAYPDEVEFCPYCGGEIDSVNAAGYCHCSECGKKFAVIEYQEPSKEGDFDA
jgi:ribosomal protein L37AE/L43A